MGILTSLASQLVDFGLGQLDNYITREIQEGREANALRAADAWEKDIVARMQQGQNLMTMIDQEQTALPAVNSLTAGVRRGILPVDASAPGMQAELQRVRQLPEIPREVGNSNLAQSLVHNRAQQFIENDPYFVQQEAAQKAAEERMGLVKGMVGEGFKQNQMGFQEGLGAFDNPAGYNLTREDRNLRSQERAFGQTMVQEQAKEPFRDIAMQRQIRVKQTPGARAAGPGGDEGGPVNTIAPQMYDTIRKQVIKYPQLRFASGVDNQAQPIYEINERGQRVAQIIEEKYASTKKPNYGAIEREAISQEAKEFNSKGKLGQGKVTGPAKYFEAFSGSKPITPATPEAQAASVQKRAVQLTEQDRKDIERMRTELQMTDEEINAVLKKAGKISRDPVIEKKISAVKAIGKTDKQIRDALMADGIDPGIYGY